MWYEDVVAIPVTVPKQVKKFSKVRILEKHLILKK